MRITKDIFDKHVDVVEAGVEIFKEGDLGSEMYIIIEGCVEISKKTTSDTSKTLITLNKGDIFGEMSLIDNKKRSATARTIEKSKLLIMNENLFNLMIEKNSDFAVKMIKLLSERLRKSNVIIQDLASNNKEKQVLGGLLEFSEKNGAVSFKGKRVNVDEYCAWASGHLGISEADVKMYIRGFVQRHIIESSAASDDFVVIPKSKSY